MNSKSIKPGDKFGRLTVIVRDPNSSGRRQKWICKCECGEIRIPRFDSLLSEQTQSCGCLQKEKQKDSVATHGMLGTRTFKAYWAMRGRCENNEENQYFENYAGRGIRVCEKWMDSFENFLDSMGECPDGLTLERIDNNKGYEPLNCRWATIKEQSRNKRTNRLVTHDGKTKTIAEWSEITGISLQRIAQRLNKGWSPERALTEPIDTRKSNRP